MLRTIGEIQPTYVVGENVRGLTNWNGGLVFDEVQADLEAEGYEIAPFLLPACGVNAPHIRERIFFVAYSASNRRIREGKAIENENGKSRSGEFRELARGPERFCFHGNITNANGKGLPIRIQTGQRGDDNQARTFQGSESSRKYTKNYWQEFPTVSPICNGNDGLSERLDGITFPKWRSESIKAGGNAIVPQIAFEIFKAIEQTHILNQTTT